MHNILQSLDHVFKIYGGGNLYNLFRISSPKGI